MSFYEEERELRCVLSWFSNWETPQKEQFLAVLVEKAVPPDIDQLFQGLDRLNLNSSFQSVLQCQLRLFSQWFDAWPCKYRNLLLVSLELQDPSFVEKFHYLVNEKNAAASGQN
ncbi:uncharacterized protein C14orf119-like [Macrobrachium nipponense]|uniref:uncharacterized protein C14orf119-like n=1 Tax=Macrobrachium nipponense TaxID=159736 RepID=UPI0030C86B62